MTEGQEAAKWHRLASGRFTRYKDGVNEELRPDYLNSLEAALQAKDGELADLRHDLHQLTTAHMYIDTQGKRIVELVRDNDALQALAELAREADQWAIPLSEGVTLHATSSEIMNARDWLRRLHKAEAQ